MSSFRCPSCGFLNFAAAEACKRCKTEFVQARVSSFTPPAEANHSYDNSSQYQYTPSPGYGQQSYDAPQMYNPSPYQYRAAGNGDKKKGLATASLIVGIVGFFTFGLMLVGAIVGLIMGISAFKKAKNQPHEFGGKELSVGGIVLNGIGVLFGIFGIFYIGVIVAIVVPNIFASIKAANESSAINGMRVMIAAEQTYISTAGGGRCGDLAELKSQGLIDETLAGGQKNGYKFSITKGANGVCELYATPKDTASGTRSFYASTNEGEIRAANKNGAPADKNDPMLKYLEPTKRNRSYDEDEY